MYDITDHESFVKVRKWVRELRNIVGNEISIVIAGNKYDLQKKRAVPEEEALQFVPEPAALSPNSRRIPTNALFPWTLRYAEDVGAKHIYTSAKTNMNLEEAFTELATRKSSVSLCLSGRYKG